ncbi:MAG: type IV secretion system DNA-binding domain-containing protein [Bifidobacteriaceae bacterium]|jgi:hypothetical protein|nr:type IV secretion system DNA-binding domain-containing protein [Bifidobacteriaceae bacterium]
MSARRTPEQTSANQGPVCDRSPIAFKVAGLVPGTQPDKAAAWAVANTRNVVKNWPYDAMLTIVLEGDKGAVRMCGWVNQEAPEDWLDDLKYALRPIAVIKSTTQMPKLAEAMAEIVPRQAARADDYAQLVGAPDDSSKTGLGRDAVAIGLRDPMWDLLSVLNWPGAAVSVSLSPATQIEQQLVDDTWGKAFTGAPKAEWQMYRGTPIRVRTFLHSACDRIPARALAEVMMISQRVEVRSIEPVDRVELRQLTVDCLRGHVLPEGAVGAIVHLPAAGENRPVPGMKVLPQRRNLIPYDRPPKPAVAYRLGRSVDVRQKSQSVWVSPTDLLRHMRLVGATGAGKSVAVRALMGQLIEDGCGMMALDPPGTLCHDLMGDISDPDRVLYADLSDTEHIVPINPLAALHLAEFEARLQAFVNMIVDRDSEEFTGPRWRRAFGLAARGSRKVYGPNVSLVMIFAILGSRDLCRDLAAALLPIDPALSRQITQVLVNVSNDSSSDLWGWLECKGEEVNGSHGLVRLLGSGAHAFDLTTAMDRSQVVLVNLGLAELGERSAQLIGCCLVAELRQAMLARKDRSKPFYLVIDEAHLFQYGALPSLLDEARKFGVGVIVCHQRPDQLRYQLKDALSANAGSYVQLRTGNPHDAAQASLMLNNWPVRDLTRMPDLTGVAVVSRDGRPSEPFSIEFDFFKRQAAALEDVELRAWRINRVIARSHKLLSDPYRGLPTVSPETITEDLKRAGARARAQAAVDRAGQASGSSSNGRMPSLAKQGR